LIPYTTLNGAGHRLESFTCSIGFEPLASSRLKAGKVPDSYAANSVLSAGKWLKISIDESGVFKIPYSTLTEWGFSSPAQVRLFGYGGVMDPG
jgi:hypothetical protein